MVKAMNITEVNAIPEEVFIEAFGNVVENFPKAASELLKLRPFSSIQEVVDFICNFLENLPSKDKEDILQHHPDLAGRLTDEGKLTAESTREQQAAGLFNLSTRNKHEMTQLNERYKQKFGFPFVVCARENKVTAILEGLKKRLGNSYQVELETGICEVKKISAFRIKELIQTT